MKQKLIWRSAILAIFNNKKRSFLTIFGIVIGIAAVITIVAVGNGFKDANMSSFNISSKSENNRYIRVKYFNIDDFLGEQRNIPKTDIGMIKQVAGVEDVGYYKMFKDTEQEAITFHNNHRDLNITMQKVSEKATPKALELINGRAISEADSDNLNKVVVLDEVVANELFQSADQALGHSFRLDKQDYLVVGVTKNVSGGISPGNYSPLAYFPKKAYEYYQGKKNDESEIYVKITQTSQPDEVITNVLDTLNKRGSLKALGEYEAFDPKADVKQMARLFDQLTLFISAVAAISLFIAGVGVMNMMYISVAERNKEIGIRRALGATQTDIRRQFLNEGIALTLFGGVVGYLIGLALAALISLFLPFSVKVDLVTISIAIGTSVLIGVGFSYFPASNAAKKDLIDILK